MSVVHGPISIASVPSVPWKNGGGTTRTLIDEPEGSGMEDFLWRISLAEIADSGSFSSFPEIDRTIMLWRGEGVLLRSPSWRTQALTQAMQPFVFRGEDVVHCELVGGITSDLNLMARRGAIAAEFRTFNANTLLKPQHEDIIVLCMEGSIRLSIEQQPSFSLSADHFVRISSVDSSITITLETTDSLYICALIQRLARNV